MELNQEQLTIIKAPEKKIAVEACAAATKTTVLIERVRYLLQSGIDPKRIAVITFTKMAAQECVDRLGEDYNSGLFVGTIHSLAARFLSMCGRGGMIGQIAEDEEFDRLFELCKDLNLHNSYDWILLDEAQDTGELEMEFIFHMIQPPCYFVVMDRRQSIYGFKGAKPELLPKYLAGATWYTLNRNYRNGKTILDYAKRIINKTSLNDTSKPARNYYGQVLEMHYDSDKIEEYIRALDEYSDWAILCRTNNDIYKIQADFRRMNIPYDTFRQGDLTKEELEKRMSANTVKILTAHSSKGLAWNNVIVYGMRWWNEEEYRLNYVAATRARNTLIWILPENKKRRGH